MDERTERIAAALADDLAQADRQMGDLWEELRGKRIFLTGGTGIVGKWLLETLAHARRHRDLGCTVTLLSRDPAGFCAAWPHLADTSWINLIAGDVRHFTVPAGRHDLVIHAATDCVDPGSDVELFDTCLEGTRAVLEFAKHHDVTRFLMISSGAIYGRQPETMAAIPESYLGGPDLLSSASGYAEGKRAAEWLAVAFGKAHGIAVTVARIFSMVGPYLPLAQKFAIGNFIKNVVHGEPIIIKSHGMVYRSYLYLPEQAVWLWTMLLKGAAGTAYNVSGAEAISLRDLAKRVNDVLGGPGDIQILTDFEPDQKAEWYVADIAKAQAELGLRPIKTLDDAIRKTAKWARLGLG